MSLRKGRLRQIYHWLVKGHLVKKYIIHRYSKNANPRLLQVGGGHYTLPGWINGDLIGGEIYLNATAPLPFADESIDRVFAEHFIEHITYEAAEGFLSEVFRVMKPGGTLRLATPDLEKLCALYRGDNEFVDMQTVIDRHSKNHSRKVPTSAHFMNDIFRLWGHQFIYDFQAMQTQLNNAGFQATLRVSFGESEDPLLHDLERHADTEWMKEGFQLIIETHKPTAQ